MNLDQDRVELVEEIGTRLEEAARGGRSEFMAEVHAIARELWPDDGPKPTGWPEYGSGE